MSAVVFQSIFNQAHTLLSTQLVCILALFTVSVTIGAIAEKFLKGKSHADNLGSCLPDTW